MICEMYNFYCDLICEMYKLLSVILAIPESKENALLGLLDFGGEVVIPSKRPKVAVEIAAAGDFSDAKKKNNQATKWISQEIVYLEISHVRMSREIGRA